MKYNYDKTALKSLSVGPFLANTKTRDKKIAEAPDTLPVSEFNANILAKKLHPSVQYAKISKVIDRGSAKTFVLVPDIDKGTKALAYFRAGQYISVSLTIGDAVLNKPYSLSSNPKDALGDNNTSYSITVKRNAKGYASDYILDNWKEGSSVTLSGPLGEFYYQRLRDAKTIIGVAGGSGITPFCSLASAIADGIEDVKLVLLYGSRVKSDILFKDELDSLAARSKDKVKVVYVLSDEKSEGFESGFITAELIKKYAPKGDYSVFMCGPRAMYSFMDGELAKLGLKRRRVRREVLGEYGDPSQDEKYPSKDIEKVYKVKVHICNDVKEISCRAEQTLLSSMEQAGIHAPSHCRSGECGWCHSLLVSGNVFIPDAVDGRRLADSKFGWIHPCCTYPLSDVEIELPSAK